MVEVAVNRSECFRIPTGVEFQRWQGEEEWVLYHSGTGETMRLSDAAVVVLDLLETARTLNKASMESAINTMLDTPLSNTEIQAALDELLRVLLTHECVERVSCG